MKKSYWKSILFGGLLLVATACGSSEDTSSEAEGEATTDEAERESYVVATDNAYVPFEFLDEETGELVGFDIDLMTAIADEAGFDIEFEAMEFDGIVAGIGSGRFDIGIAGMTITEERKENIDFSQPYYEAGLIVAVQADNDEINSVDDLDGKTVATRTGSTSETYIRENTGGTPEAFPQITEAYQNVIQGRADAVIYDIPNVQYYASTEGGGQLKTIGEPLTGEEYGIAFPKGSELRDIADEALTTLMEDGTYADLYEKWFGERPEGM
ncbi:glutamine ABC transporter substrate-binding protein [Alkalihalophilus sp. As8PL]|uniref:Glutamine ABC transporter substrate-binding protein n=1 Tax=Alkalihalophilus sp. As8PL TaxID=3237103 RepID=A0AB39BXK7_9BACI